ncbi:TlpA family protein disulfide reductase [Hymenobacter sublimis]|uniref:TlpA family protein disulfide reductase n=1 Tax=Hymenobacter sublimis TaxID=2933777 RepID=A0ABY4JD00_9BACT|nr:TlpA disulfide reductase family protein [Hymenobacter sublimis]UPL50668.1 TlpA family protein disulfide reductase [Hymenobacter sublimis]
MKYLVPVVFALSGCATLRTSSPPAAPLAMVAPTTAVLRGRLLHAAPHDTVRIWRKLPPLAERGQQKFPVAPDGSFEVRLTGLTGPIDAQLVLGDALTVYLSPGDSLELTADRQQLLATLRFRGRGAHANNYLTQAQRHFDYNFGELPENLHAAVTPPEFRQRADAYHQRQLDTLAAWQARQPLPAELVTLRRQLLELQRGLSLLRYVGHRKGQAQREPELPAGYFDFLKTLPLPAEGLFAARPTFLQTLAFFHGAYSYVFLLPPSDQLSLAPNLPDRLYAPATAHLGETTLRDQVIGEMLLRQLYDFPTTRAAVGAVLPTYLARTHDSTYVRSVRHAWRVTGGLQPGQLAPAFALRDGQGQTVTLADFRGKVIYLDFWYSSCAPCLAETPAAVKLKKQFLGRDVVFLYISVDRKATDWQRALAKYPLTSPGSVHLLDPGGEKASSAYGVSAFPSYWIIGRDGRIWRGGAPRPSAGTETVAALEQALAQKP